MATSVISTTSKWKEFLTRYYKNQIQELAVSDAKNKALVIEYPHINRFDVRLAEELKASPDVVLAHAEEALTMVDLPVKKRSSARVRVINYSKHIKINDLDHQHVNKMVSLDVIVQGVRQPADRIVEAVFECARCKNITIIPQEGGGKFIEPTYCRCNEEKKGVFRLLYGESRFENYQRIQLSDNADETMMGSKPDELEANLTEDLVRAAWPGDRVIINGVIRSSQRFNKDGKTSYFERYMDVNSVEREVVDFTDYVIPSETAEKIRDEARKDGSAERFASCIAPWIKGMGLMKMAITSMLFGGVRRQIGPGKFERSEINLAIITDPGIGKSDIMEAVQKIAPRSWYGSGGGLSGVGLTAAVVPDDFGGDHFILKPGIMPLFRYALIDEVGRIGKSELEKLHTAMEQGRIPIAKGGIKADLQTRCSILFAGNPVNGRWNEYDDPNEQIGLDPALMNRIALFILVRDVPNEKKDREVARQALAEQSDYETPFTIEFLRMWIVLAQRECRPEFPEEMKQLLEDYYVKLRSGQVGDELKIIHPTPRQLKDARRISESFAKLRFSPVVEKKDVERALKILAESIQTALKGDADFANVGTDTSQSARIRTIIDVIGELQTDQQGVGVPVLDVLDECEARKLNRKKTERDLVHMVSDKVLWHVDLDKSKIAISNN